MLYKQGASYKGADNDSLMSAKRRHIRRKLSQSWIIWLFILTSCGGNLAVIQWSQLDSLPESDIQALQFYSGNRKIVFRAHVREEAAAVKRNVLITSDNQTEYILTISPGTPGVLKEVDPYGRALFIQFDPALPSLEYRQGVDGMILVSNQLEVDGVVYDRDKDFPNAPVGRSAYAPCYLAVKTARESKEKMEKQKLKGIRRSQAQ